MDTKRKNGIFWIASYPRSGDMWVRVFLQNLVPIMSGVDKEQDLNALETFSPWDNARRYYAKYLGPEPAGNELQKIAPIRQLMQRDLANRSSGLEFVKTHGPLGHFYGYSSIDFSITAGALYLVRNPLDVAISLAHVLDGKIDHIINFMSNPHAYAAGDATRIPEFFGSWSHNVASWTSKPNAFVMRYEDMLDNPELWLSVLSRHIFDPAPPPEQIRKAIDRSSFDKLNPQGFGFQQEPVDAIFREGRAGQWKDALTPQQIDRITSDHREQMARFGYCDAAGA
jgi:Sulfotransferase domain